MFISIDTTLLSCVEIILQFVDLLQSSIKYLSLNIFKMLVSWYFYTAGAHVQAKKHAATVTISTQVHHTHGDTAHY